VLADSFRCHGSALDRAEVRLTFPGAGVAENGQPGSAACYGRTLRLSCWEWAAARSWYGCDVFKPLYVVESVVRQYLGDSVGHTALACAFVSGLLQ
jgi:hypothetical protein